MVTYAPKRNRHGEVYHYYRCANGKGVHPHEMYVTEAEILRQLSGAFALISISHSFADALVFAVNENTARPSEQRQRNWSSTRRSARRSVRARTGCTTDSTRER